MISPICPKSACRVLTSNSADDLSGSLEDTGKAADDSAKGGLANFASALAGAVADAVVFAIGKLKDLATEAISVGKQFDASMSEVKAISNATGEEYDKLRAKAKEMGSETKFTASQTADAFSYMAMAGWKTEEMLEGVDGVLNLAAASNTDLATTSDIVSKKHVNEELKRVTVKENYPAKGKYSRKNNNTASSIDTDMTVQKQQRGRPGAL